MVETRSIKRDRSMLPEFVPQILTVHKKIKICHQSNHQEQLSAGEMDTILKLKWMYPTEYQHRIEYIIRSWSCFNCFDVNNSNNSCYIFRDLVAFLVRAHRWDGIRLICENMSFRFGDVYETGVFCSLLGCEFLSNETMALLLSKVPKVVSGNAGLKHFDNYPSRLCLLPKVLHMNPLAVLLPNNFSPNIIHYNYRKYKSVYFPEYYTKSSKFVVSFVARQWRAITEVCQNIPKNDETLMISKVLPFLPNPAYSFIDNNVDRRKSLKDCFGIWYIKENCLESGRGLNTLDVQNHMRCLLDFLPFSVLSYEGTENELSVLNQLKHLLSLVRSDLPVEPNGSLKFI